LGITLICRAGKSSLCGSTADICYPEPGAEPGLLIYIKPSYHGRPGSPWARDARGQRHL